MTTNRCLRCKRLNLSAASYCRHCGYALRSRPHERSSSSGGGRLIVVAWAIAMIITVRMLVKSFPSDELGGIEAGLSGWTAGQIGGSSEPWEADAASVIFICGVNQTRSAEAGAVRADILRAIDSLGPEQRFNVIVPVGAGLAANRWELLRATEGNKRRARELAMRAERGGTPDVLGALEIAFRQRPETIYLVADCSLSPVGDEAVVRSCRQRNLGRLVRINTIAVPGPSRGCGRDEARFVRALRTIAADSGGTFRVVR